MATKTDLVIVESPSKAKTIGKYLGSGYEAVSYTHLDVYKRQALDWACPS